MRINKSGKQLSDWETMLVENRNSSFARGVMSIANISSAEHYWPSSKAPGEIEKPELEQKVEEIRSGVEDLYHTLFDPPFAPSRRIF